MRVDYRHIGTALRNLRMAKFMTLAQAAKSTGLSVSFLSEVERERSSPSFCTLLLLSTLYNETLEIVVTPAYRPGSLADMIGRMAAAQHDRHGTGEEREW